MALRLPIEQVTVRFRNLIHIGASVFIFALCSTLISLT